MATNPPTLEPLSADCTGVMVRGSKLSDEAEPAPFTYFGNTLHFDPYSDNDKKPSNMITLLHSLTTSDFPPFEECYENRIGDEDETYWRAV